MKVCALCDSPADGGTIVCPQCGGGLFRNKSKFHQSLKGVFISYSRSDFPRARVLVEEFQRLGIHVWWDQGEIRGGERFEDQIVQALEQVVRVIVLWSRSSVSSKYVLLEAEHGLKRRNLLPVWIEKTTLPAPFDQLHTIDLSTWDGSRQSPQLTQLVSDVQFFLHLAGQ